VNTKTEPVILLREESVVLLKYMYTKDGSVLLERDTTDDSVF